MITIRVFIITLLALSSQYLCGQIQPGTRAENQDSAWIAQQDYINGAYIPADEEDAYSEVKALTQGKGLEKFKGAVEDSIRRKLHFGLGGWMMKNWRLERGSRLSYYLKDRGLLHPDDMVEYLIISLHRNLNEVDQDYDSLIEEFRLKRLKIAEDLKAKKLKNGVIIQELDPSQVNKKKRKE